VHSKQGEELVRSSNLVLHPTSWEKSLPANPRIVTGKNWLYYHPARLFRKTHLRYLPDQLIEKIYANTMQKYDFILYPYKFINVTLRFFNKLSKNKSLKRILANGNSQ
jgi:hypothetical protein